MQKRDASPNPGLIIVWLLLTGIGIGWLLGLAVSPVVSIVITTITGAAAAVVAALSGLEDKANRPDEANKASIGSVRWNINPLPLAMLVLGLLAGSVLGIAARNYSWLGSEATGEVTQWTQAGLTGPGWTRADIARKLFESRYSAHSAITNTVTSAEPKGAIPFGTVLFAVHTEECKTLLAAARLSAKNPSDTALRDALASSPVDQFARLPAVVTDTTVLRNVVEQVLCAGAQ
ncbi:MAG: hypothetical protein U0350_44720 [Caldilineaceae bacterium]